MNTFKKLWFSIKNKAKKACKNKTVQEIFFYIMYSVFIYFVLVGIGYSTNYKTYLMAFGIYIIYQEVVGDMIKIAFTHRGK